VPGKNYVKVLVEKNPLLRAALLKLEPGRYRILLMFNHLIFDGLCSSILHKQLHHLSRGIEEAQEEKELNTHYRHYIELMNAQNYENIPLEKYINLYDYACSIEESTKHFTVSNTKTETFQLDILNIKFKDYYNEIVLLVFAKTISQFFGIETGKKMKNVGMMECLECWVWKIDWGF
jgi:hypothetical protein